MSSTLKKTGNILLNTLGASPNGYGNLTDTSGYQNLINYYNQLNTMPADYTYQNMAQNALNLSQSLANRPDYVYQVDGSEQARQDAQNAVYQNYLSQLTPVFDQQTADLKTSLLNQGLSVGSEAYQRAMNDLMETQNKSLNQAVYQSVLAGQNAYSQSLADSIKAGNFQNEARTLPISELYALLKNTPSELEKNKAVSDLQNQVAQTQTKDNQNNFANALAWLKLFM